VLASIFYCKENDGTIGAALLHQILPETERGVKGLKVLAVVGITMSKRFWDTGVL